MRIIFLFPVQLDEDDVKRILLFLLAWFGIGGAVIFSIFGIKGCGDTREAKREMRRQFVDQIKSYKKYIDKGEPLPDVRWGGDFDDDDQSIRRHFGVLETGSDADKKKVFANGFEREKLKEAWFFVRFLYEDLEVIRWGKKQYPQGPFYIRRQQYGFGLLNGEKLIRWELDDLQEQYRKLKAAPSPLTRIPEADALCKQALGECEEFFKSLQR
jgi:hypothetical protein